MTRSVVTMDVCGAPRGDDGDDGDGRYETQTVGSATHQMSMRHEHQLPPSLSSAAAGNAAALSLSLSWKASDGHVRFLHARPVGGGVLILLGG